MWQGGGRKKRTELTFTVKKRDMLLDRIAVFLEKSVTAEVVEYVSLKTTGPI